MSENGEIYTAGNKFYTPAGTDGMDKFHLCEGPAAHFGKAEFRVRVGGKGFEQVGGEAGQRF